MKWTLKAIRTNLNLRQDEMAEKLGVTEKTYQNYETYKTFPDVQVVKRIVKLSNIDFNDIIFLPEEYAKSVQTKCRKE